MDEPHFPDDPRKERKVTPTGPVPRPSAGARAHRLRSLLGARGSTQWIGSSPASIRMRTRSASEDAAIFSMM